MRKRLYSPEQHVEIARLRQEGKTLRELQERFGGTILSVRRAIIRMMPPEARPVPRPRRFIQPPPAIAAPAPPLDVNKLPEVQRLRRELDDALVELALLREQVKAYKATQPCAVPRPDLPPIIGDVIHRATGTGRARSQPIKGFVHVPRGAA